MTTSIKSIRTIKITLLLRTLCACLVVVALSFAAIPTPAGGAEDKAKKAFADWKTAQGDVAAAKEKLADAQKALQNAMTAVAKSGGKTTPEQEAVLAKGRADAAAAEAALRKAEKQELVARVALENAIAELPDGPLKDQLKRERNFPSLVTANGLHTVKFDTPSGLLTVSLPADKRAGDTISGTVVAEPKGNTAEERAKNTAELSGYVVELNSPKPRNEGDKKPPPNVLVILHAAKPNGFKITLPDAKTGQKLDVNLRQLAPGESSKFGAPNYFPLRENETAPGRMIATASDAYMELSEPSVFGSVLAINDFNIPKIVQQGHPIEIIGPFDGDFSNTTLKSSAQDFEKSTENDSGGFVLIAESPRKAVFENSTTSTGPIQLTLKEGNKETKGTYRNVGLNLAAPRTQLIKGEHTTLTIQVTGLKGITQPVPLTLESRGVITMEGGMYQPLVIQPSEVGADGGYSTTRGITGVQAGGWDATATVVTQPFNIVLRDPDPPQTILVNSFTGDYSFCGTDFKLTGTGTIKRSGCVIRLTDNKPDRQVQGTLDGCVPVDNGRLFTFYSPGTITDLKVTVTGTQPPIRKVYFKYPHGKPAPVIQDVSAFATCP